MLLKEEKEICFLSVSQYLFHKHFVSKHYQFNFVTLFSQTCSFKSTVKVLTGRATAHTCSYIQSSTDHFLVRVNAEHHKDVGGAECYLVKSCSLVDEAETGVEHVAEMHVVRGGGPEMVASSSPIISCQSDSLSHRKSLCTTNINFIFYCTRAIIT